MSKQFFGKTTWIVLAAIAAVHLLAIPLLHAQVPSLIALGIIMVGAFVLTFRSLEYGLLLAFTEIMVGGHGHLIEATLYDFPLSLRMAVFIGVMAGWGVLFVLRRARPSFVALRDAPFAVLGLSVIIGTIIGLLRHDTGLVLDDMNGYVTLLYLLPIASITWNNEAKRRLLQTLTASVLWIAISTLVLLFLFTHLPGKALHEVYRFVRDSRLAEVTLLTGPDWFVGNLLPSSSPWYFRVFEPAQFFLIAMGLILLAARFILWRGGRIEHGARWLFILSIAAFVTGLSRSFIIGLAAGGLVTLIGAVLDAPRPIGHNVRNTASLIGLSIIGVALCWLTIVIPLPPHPDLRDAAFYQETDSGERDLAVSSRWNLLPPLMTAISEHPVLGNGFGSEVTFISDDPRVREINPTGEWTTYRFEWGYQDIWLKTGLLGLVGFALILYSIIKAGVLTYRSHGHGWLVLGLIGGVIALYATHVFSPYLNHPIGLGYLLFVLPFLDWHAGPKTQAPPDITPMYLDTLRSVSIAQPVTSQRQ